VLSRPGAKHYDDKWKLLDTMVDSGAAVVGTPDDLVKSILKLQEVTGGFGCAVGFAHDWANHDATRRSWEMIGRYVIPEINGHLRGVRASAAFLTANQEELMKGASNAVMAKIRETPGAYDALKTTLSQRSTQKKGPEWRPGADVTLDDKATTD